MWHLVCGDNAVAGVTHVIGEAVAATALRVLRDDLAVGPLADVDTTCAARAAFWRAVWPHAMKPVPDFATDLAEDARWLALLAQQSRPVTVWHGDSCTEQLLLARVAHALQGSPVELWEVPCGSGDSRVEQRMAVAMHRPEALAQVATPRLVDVQRKATLAAQWQTLLADPQPVRRWQAGAFNSEDYQAVDRILLEHAGEQQQPLARLMAEVMARSDGFFATDFFVFWRARELVAADQLRLSGEPAEHGYGGLQVSLSAGG